MQNYSQSQIDQLQVAVNQGYRLILPEDAHIDLNEWRGAGYIKTYADENSASVGMIISGNYYGGYGGYQEPVNIPETHYQTTVSNPPPSKDIGKHTVPVKDPLDIASGAFLHNHTDLSLGKAEPLGLHFTRSYNSSANYEKRSLCYGWAHNYDIYLEGHSHGDPGLGARLPVDAASAIAGFYVTFDLMKNHDDLQGWLITSLSQKWAIDQLIDNAVTVHLGGKSLEYIKLADGAYSPPSCVTTKLIDNGATFTLEERFDTSLDFNTDNRITSWQDADGNTLTFTYSSGKLHNVQDAFGRTLTLGYDGDYISSVSDSTGRSVSYQYSGDDLTSYIDPEGHSWSYSYSDHRMETLTDPLSVVMATNVYDDLGRVKTQTNGNNKTYQFYYSTYRNIEEDPDGNPIIYYFDHDGRQIGQEDALGNRSYTTYDGQGHVISVTDPRQNTTQFEYDGNHNRIKMTDAQSNHTGYDYDQHHRMTDAHVDLAGLNIHTHFDYDSEHHLTGTIVYPESGKQIETNATYYTNGLTHTVTDGRGTATTMTYDSCGNPDTTQTGSQPAVDSDYDLIGRITKLTDQANAATTFHYDDRGLLETRTDPLLKTVTFAYYDDGNVHTVTDRNNDVIEYAYTPSDKVDTVTYPDASTVSFGYDGRDNMTSMQDSLGNTAYTYDAANRLTSVTDPHGFVIGYSYDEAGNLITLTYPDNKTVSYTYDAMNRLETVTVDWRGKTATYHYDTAGRLSELDHFNGTWTSYGHDNANRLTNLQNRKSDATAIATYSFILDDNGNRQQVTLEGGLGPAVWPMNIAYTYNAEKNRLLSDGLSSFSYDDEGQLSARDDIQYTFDAAHRLLGSTGSVPCQYFYDGNNNRLKSIRNGVTTKYIYDASGNLLAKADANNTILCYYIYGKGLVAIVSASGKLYCYHFDANANTIALTDSGQHIGLTYAYTPFAIACGSVSLIYEPPDVVVRQPFKFVGQFGVMTERNGLYYMRARYYDPQVGRFISEDPLGFGGGDLNLYQYAHANPIMFMDPWGLSPPTRGERIGQIVQWQVQVSGLTNLPGIAKETVQVLGAAGVGLAAYAAYPVVVTTIVTHPQETLDFVMSLSPGTTPAMSSVYGPLGAAVGDLLGVK